MPVPKKLPTMFSSPVQIQDNNGSARLILSKKASRVSAADKQRLFLTICFHMDTGAVSDIPRRLLSPAISSSFVHSALPFPLIVLL